MTISSERLALTHLLRAPATRLERLTAKFRLVDRFPVLSVFLALSLFQTAGAAHAQDYPVRIIRFIVGFPAGGGTDIVARITAESLGRVLNQRVIVENKPGANTAIAIQSVLKSPADGYTLLFGTTSIASSLYGMKEPGYRLEDFAVIGGVTSAPLMLIVNTASSKARTLQEFVAFGKANPDRLTFASDGPTSVNNVMASRLRETGKFTGREIPYKGGAQIMPDLMSGIVDAFMGLPSTYMAVMNRPNMTALAIANDERMEAFPDVPTFAESGYPTISDISVTGLWISAAAPKPVIDKLRSALAEAMQSPDFKERVEKTKSLVYSQSPAEFEQAIRKTALRFKMDFEHLGIQPQ